MASKRRRSISLRDVESKDKHGHVIKERKDRVARDLKKLAIVAFLVKKDAEHKRATVNEIRNKAAIKTKQEPYDFNAIMSELLSMQRIEFYPKTSDGGYDEYTVSVRGSNALNKAKEIVRENNPLADLEAFSNILDL